MKTASFLLVAVALASPAIAAASEAGEDFGLLVSLFLGFGSLVVSAKLIPGILRFASLINTESSSEPEESASSAPKVL